MKHLPPPPFSAKSTLELCATCRDESALQVRVKSISAYVETAEAAYSQHGTAATLFTIAPTNGVNGCVTTDEMKQLYNGTLARSNSAARYVYDAIKLSSKLCPLCGLRQVSQLDHYLAKSLHPTYAVAPINLVPTCSDCNKAKRDKQPRTSGEQTLHPYFDDIDDVVWLHASVDETEPPTVTFQMRPGKRWSNVKRQRASHHFDTFGLGELYATYAAEELVLMEQRLRTLADTGGQRSVRTYLVQERVSRRAAAKNSWQAAMFGALSQSRWFYQGGHKQICSNGT